MSLIKIELAKSISFDTGFSQEKSLEILSILLDLIKSTLVKGDDISIKRFGKFYVKTQKERKIRHPVTGKIIIIGSRKTVKFRCSKSLQKEINVCEFDSIEPRNKIILQQLYELIENAKNNENQEDNEEDLE